MHACRADLATGMVTCRWCRQIDPCAFILQMSTVLLKPRAVPVAPARPVPSNTSTVRWVPQCLSPCDWQDPAQLAEAIKQGRDGVLILKSTRQAPFQDIKSLFDGVTPELAARANTAVPWQERYSFGLEGCPWGGQVRRKCSKLPNALDRILSLKDCQVLAQVLVK